VAPTAARRADRAAFDHGTQFTSWAFGRRLHDARLLGSMGSIGDCYDNPMIESFFGTLQRELLDEHRWTSREQLSSAIFEWIEGCTTRLDDTPRSATCPQPPTKPCTTSLPSQRDPTPQPSALPGEAQR
jgi:Integrase core domain